jgi:hypothetical protein
MLICKYGNLKGKTVGLFRYFIADFLLKYAMLV